MQCMVHSTQPSEAAIIEVLHKWNCWCGIWGKKHGQKLAKAVQAGFGKCAICLHNALDQELLIRRCGSPGWAAASLAWLGSREWEHLEPAPVTLPGPQQVTELSKVNAGDHSWTSHDCISFKVNDSALSVCDTELLFYSSKLPSALCC